MNWLVEIVSTRDFQINVGYSAGLVLVCVLSFFAVKLWLLRFINVVLRRTKTSWDDVLFSKGVFNSLAYVAPLLISYWGVLRFPDIAPFARKLIVLFVVALLVITVRRTLAAALDIYNTYEISRKRPLKGYVQVTTLLVYIAGGITVVSLVLDRSPWGLLGGLGALTAVLLLVFRDTILSFIASLQLALNDMVRVGDWIEMPKFGADGEVMDMALHTIKIQNWDKTIVTIPTYKLIEESFRNWRGMSEAGGRRIMRSILIDQRTVRFLTEPELTQLRRIAILKPYLEERQAQIDLYNQSHDVDATVAVNGRRMTNVGVFRAYVLAYLRQHPAVAQNMTLLVRQLEPTASGLPLQLYLFTATTVWAEYEAVQADIFDHLLAAIGFFGLRVFQQPSGHDVTDLAASLQRSTPGQPRDEQLAPAPASSTLS